jgi:hypothetical protein
MDAEQLASNFVADYPLSVGSSTVMVKETAKRHQSAPGFRRRLTHVATLAADMLHAIEQADVPDNQLFQLESYLIAAYSALTSISRRVGDEVANASVIRPTAPLEGLANAKASFPPSVDGTRQPGLQAEVKRGSRRAMPGVLGTPEEAA